MTEPTLKNRPRRTQYYPEETLVYKDAIDKWFEGFEKKHRAILNDVFLWMKQNKCMSSDASVVLKIYIQKEVLGE